jgi:ornithine--oxo-acid transaminase
LSSSTTESIIEQTQRVGAHNYAPLPVVLSRAEGVWAWDIEGRRYLDCLSAYSSVNQGHRHPRIVEALIEQANRLTLTSRAFYNDRMGPFLELLCQVCEMDAALPMNTGAEAVETAIKLARKWGYEVKQVPQDHAEIIVCRNNFHGRTTTIVGFSTDPVARNGFGPFGAGFKLIEFGDLAALEAAITPHTVGFLVEPIQAEAGIIVPKDGFLSGAKRLCASNDVLFMLDEIQTGLGRTGKLFAHQHEAGATPDVMMIGKALGGGVYPVSAVLARADVMAVLRPGTHGSTFGGNPLAAAVAQRAIEVLLDERLAERAALTGHDLFGRLRAGDFPCVHDIRGRGLLVGIEIRRTMGTARAYCERLLELGILCKDTHEQVIRLAPPLTLEREHVDWLVDRIAEAFGARH